MAWVPVMAKKVVGGIAARKGLGALVPEAWGGAKLPQSANTDQGLQTPQQIAGLNTSANQMSQPFQADPLQLPANSFADLLLKRY